MKTAFAILTCSTALVLSAPAQGTSRSLMQVLDTNKDGKLDKAEIAAAAEALGKLDSNGDGTLAGAELPSLRRRPAAAPEAPTRRIPDLSLLDKDGDGKISKEEAPERMQARFERLDRNADGVLDKEEQETILRFLRERPPAENRRGEERREDDGGTEKPKRPPVIGEE